MKGLQALVGAVALLGVAIMAAPNSVADDTLRLTVSPGRVQLVPSKDGLTTNGILDVRVIAPMSGRLTVALTDVVADEEGSWQKAPIGTTAYSLESRLSLSRTEIEVAPSDQEQAYEVKLTVQTAGMDAPRVGLVSATFTPNVDASVAGTSVNQNLEIDTAVVTEADPSAITDADNVRVSLVGNGLTVDATNEFTIVDSTIPDIIPGLVDHGPVDITAHYRNSGDFIVDAQTTFDFATVGPAALFGSDDPGDVFYTLNDANHYALPGQPAVAKGTSMVEANGASVDTLPFIGFVKVTATTTGTLGPLTAAPVVQSTVFLVFPWKEALVLILLIVLWVLFKRWRRNRRDRRNEPPPVSEVREPVESVT